MRYCVSTRVHNCTYKFAKALWENERSPERGVTYKQGYTMAQKTWAARHSVPPNLRLSNEGIKKPVITMWNQWQVWKMKTKAGCHRHNIPQTLEDAKQWQLLFGQGSGTDSGCSWRDSLDLQLRIPAPFPKGTCSSLWPSTSLSECLRDPRVRTWASPPPDLNCLSIQILALPEAWPKPITTFHF